jgi:hypothetical protein
VCRRTGTTDLDDDDGWRKELAVHNLSVSRLKRGRGVFVSIVSTNDMSKKRT